MTFRVDLHVHSRNSGDNDADPEEIVERAIERGLDGIAFTEHYSYAASADVERLREKYGRDIVLFRGVEFSAAEGHCLVFGADTDRLAVKNAPASDLVRIVAAAGGVVVPSHPYRGANSMGDLVRTLPGIAALEGCNGVNLHPLNVRAIEAARARGLPATGGSDAHAAREVGSCYTEFEERVAPETLPGLLMSGRYRPVDVRKVSRMLFRGPL